MKTVFKYDESQKLTDRVMVADDYTLQPNETFVPTPHNQYPPYTFDGEQWSGLTLEQYVQANELGKDSPKQPSAEQQMIMAQQTQIASLTESKKQLQQMAMQQQATMTQLQQLAMQQQVQISQMKEGAKS